VQTANVGAATRQCHIQGFGFELRLQLGVGQRLAAIGQRSLDRLLGEVDGGAAGFLVFHAQSSHALHQLSDATGFTQKQGFGVFEVSRCQCLHKTLAGGFDQGVQLVHGVGDR
jgi:hypothetical protein